jgi:hypothetical protein
MGCCQSREDEKQTFSKFIHKKSPSIDYNTETFDSEVSTLAFSRNSQDRTKEELSEKPLLAYAEACFRGQKWEMLAPMLTSSSIILNPPIILSWSEKPRTLSSVALIYLAEGVKKYTVQVSPFIEVFLSVILKYLKSGTSDQKELSIYLLHNYVELASEKCFEKMINSDVFLLVSKWILSPKSEVRKMTVNLCLNLYKNKIQAKEKFIEANGAFCLVQLIAWNNSHDFLEDLINALEEVIMDDSKFLIMENLERTREPKTLEILEKIDLNEKSLELKKTVERLIRYYRSFVNQSGRISQ